jgi:hypothetical protein
MSSASKSPYIENPGRLAYVIAAIQATGLHGFHKRSFDDWAAIISGDRSRATYWKKIFEEHPEFFRLDETRSLASLVWRQQCPRFHLDSGQRLSPSTYKTLSEEEKARVSRDPLSPLDIKALIETAINVQSRAVELQREARWLWIPLMSTLGALLGAIFGAWLKG